MKTLVMMTVGALLLVASGCTSTVTLGPKANKGGSYLDASANTGGVGVTLPWVKAQVDNDLDD